MNEEKASRLINKNPPVPSQPCVRCSKASIMLLLSSENETLCSLGLAHQAAFPGNGAGCKRASEEKTCTRSSQCGKNTPLGMA